MAVGTIRRPKGGEVSHAGRASQFWGTIGVHTYDPDQVSLTTFDDMRRTDETIKAALQFVKLSVTAKLGAYEHEDEKVQEFVETALRMMEGTLEGVVSGLLSAMWAGFSVAELVYDTMREGPWKGKVYYRKIKVLHPLSVWPNGIKADKFGNIERIVQSEGQPGQAVLEKGKFVHWTYDGGVGTFGSPWGTSALRACHRWWFAKDLTVKLWGMFLEKFGLPLLVGKFVPGETECPVDGNTEDGVLAGLHMLTTYQTQTEMAFAMQTDAQGNWDPDVPKIDVITVKERGAEEFRTMVEQADRAMMLCLLVPALALSEARYGTRAQAEVHLDSFFSMLDDVQRSVSDLILEQIIRPLLDINFSGLDDYGKWVPEPLTEQDTAIMAGNLHKLIQAEAINPTLPAFRKWVAGKFMPDLEEPEEEEEEEKPAPKLAPVVPGEEA